jgi:hypothetical protein
VQRKIVAARRFAAQTAEKIGRLERDIEARFLVNLGLKAPERTTPLKAFAVWWKNLERWSVMFNRLASVAIDISGFKFPVTNLNHRARICS